MFRNKQQTTEIRSICGVSKTRSSRALDLFRPVVLRRVWNSSGKLAAASVVSLFLTAGVFATGDTASYYVNVEKSLNNIFIADPLYFSVDASTTALVLDPSIPAPGGDVTIAALMTPGETSEPIQYEVNAIPASGDTGLCSAVQVMASAPFVYDGPLLSMNTATSTQTGPWTLTFFLPLGAQVSPGVSCTLDLVYKGWNADALEGQGYSDVHKLTLTFSTPAPPPTDTSSDASSSSAAASPRSGLDDGMAQTAPNEPFDPLTRRRATLRHQVRPCVTKVRPCRRDG